MEQVLGKLVALLAGDQSGAVWLGVLIAGGLAAVVLLLLRAKKFKLVIEYTSQDKKETT